MLLKQNYQITTLNRGSDYYNSRSNISPKVTVLECDRFKGLKRQCPAFMEYIAANSQVS